jgi:replicative DNA helicase Mcm
MSETEQEYWERFLKKSNKSEIDRIALDYPKFKVLCIDVSKILNTEIWTETLRNPGGQGTFIEEALNNILPKPETGYFKVNVRFFNVTQKRKIKDLRGKDEKKLISIKAIVSNVSPVRPKVITATYQCTAGHATLVRATQGNHSAPNTCPVDDCNFRTFKHIDRLDESIDRQWVYIQETLEDMTDGGVPNTLKCEVLEDLCGKVVAGDRVVMNGQYRSTPIKKAGITLDSKDVYFDTSSVEIDARGIDEVVLTDEDEKLIVELSKHDNLFEFISDSIAPSILRSKTLKRAITLLLFEGVSRTYPDGTQERGQINILIVTDPGMAKTKLLIFVSKLIPRGVYAVASSSSKVGLVAPLIKDETSGILGIRAGAYMLANGGVLCLDEASELSSEDFKYINECMENGEAHINKAGYNSVIKTKASLLAACNPIHGCFDFGVDAQNPCDQVKIPAASLSRFDLIPIMWDVSTEKTDRELAEHVTRNRRGKNMTTDFILPDMLRKYIAYAKKLTPELTDESEKIVNDYYVSIRKLNRPGTMNVTQRQHQSCIRLAEAHAKMRLSKTVDACDADAAVELFDMVLRQANVDPKTGMIDMNRTTHIKSRSPISAQIMQVIRECSKDTGKAAETAIIGGMSLRGWNDADKVRATLRLLSQEGAIHSPKDGTWKE